MFSKIWTKKSTNDCSGPIDTLRQVLNYADAVVIGAGSGLSTSAGFTYDGERFEQYFADFAARYGIRDMYSGGFYPYSSLEEHWAYWSRYIYINRYMDAPKPVYDALLKLVQDKDYFVLTTNVDHCFQKAGFDKSVCSTRREITACSSALSPVVGIPLIMRSSSGRWWKHRGMRFCRMVHCAHRSPHRARQRFHRNLCPIAPIAADP